MAGQPLPDPIPASERVEAILATLSLNEQVTLLSGAGLFSTAAIHDDDGRVIVPAVRLLDGPAGVRGTEFIEHRSLSVPCPSALGATWDVHTVRRVGEVLGRQVRAKGARVHLAPTVNLMRTPVGGRNFESFGEDPHHVSEMAVAYVNGVQSQDVGSCVKHYVGNDTEHERFTIDSQIDEVTLREVYLLPFEAVVKRAGAASLMAAYNKVNGTTVSENATLLTDIARDEWGLVGPIISDWYCVRSTVDALVAGTDLEMPGPTQQRGTKLLDAAAAGEIDPAVIAQAVRRLLLLIERLGALDPVTGPEEETTLDDPLDRDVLLAAAADAMVLLRNELVDDMPALPLIPERLGRVAVIGPNAARVQAGGGGSATVRPIRQSHPLDSLVRRLGADVVVHADGCSIDKRLPTFDLSLCADATLALFDTPDGATDPGAVPRIVRPLETARPMWFADPFTPDTPPRFSARITAMFTPDRSGPWTFGFRSVGDGRLSLDGTVLLDNFDVELGALAAMGKPEIEATIDLEAGRRYAVEVILRRDSDADGLSGILLGGRGPASADPIGDAERLAATADVAIVVVGTNADWETEGRDRDDIALPGDQDELIRRVAAAAPRTVVVVNAGSPVAMPWSDDVDAIVQLWFPGEVAGDALAAVLLGDREPGGRLPVTFPRALASTPTADLHPGRDGVAMYAERRLIGHRWFDAHNVDPQYAFGFGLGYTTISIVEVAPLTAEWVRVTLRNEGPRDGSQVVQVYASLDDTGGRRDDEPPRQLVGFAKSTVAAGKSTTVDIPIAPMTFNRWDESARAWAPHGRSVRLHIGTSSRDLPLTLDIPPST